MLVNLVLLAMFAIDRALLGPNMARDINEEELDLVWDAIVELLVRMVRYESQRRELLAHDLSSADRKAFLSLIKLQIEHISINSAVFEIGFQRLDVLSLTQIYKKIVKGLDSKSALKLLNSEFGEKFPSTQIRKLLLTPDQIKQRRGGSAGGPKEAALEMMARISADRGRTYLLKKLKSVKKPSITDTPDYLETSKAYFSSEVVKRVLSKLKSNKPNCPISLKFLQKNFPK